MAPDRIDQPWATNFRATQAHRELVRRLAYELDVSMNDVIVRAIESYGARHGHTVADFNDGDDVQNHRQTR